MQFFGSWRSACRVPGKLYRETSVINFLWMGLLLLIWIHIRKGVIWKLRLQKANTFNQRKSWWLSNLVSIWKSRYTPSVPTKQATIMSVYAKQSQAVGILGFESFPAIATHLSVKIIVHIWPVPWGAAAVSRSRIMGRSNTLHALLGVECQPLNNGFHSDRPRNDLTVADTRALGYWAAKWGLNPWRSISERFSIWVCSTTQGPISVLRGRTGGSFRV